MRSDRARAASLRRPFIPRARCRLLRPSRWHACTQGWLRGGLPPSASRVTVQQEWVSGVRAMKKSLFRFDPDPLPDSVDAVVACAGSADQVSGNTVSLNNALCGANVVLAPDAAGMHLLAADLWRYLQVVLNANTTPPRGMQG